MIHLSNYEVKESKQVSSGGARKNIGGGPAKYTLIYKT